MGKHIPTPVRNSQVVDGGCAIDCNPCEHHGSIFSNQIEAMTEYNMHVTTGMYQRYGKWHSTCCDMHNQHCEAPADLCCDKCTEVSHIGLFPHADKSPCVLDMQEGV